MGNTKFYLFEGTLKAGVTAPTTQQLMEWARGPYAAITVDVVGYLGRKSGDPTEGAFVVGCVHTYSMRGDNVCKELSSLFHHGTVTRVDHDYPSLEIERLPLAPDHPGVG